MFLQGDQQLIRHEGSRSSASKPRGFHLGVLQQPVGHGGAALGGSRRQAAHLQLTSCHPIPARITSDHSSRRRDGGGPSVSDLVIQTGAFFLVQAGGELPGFLGLACAVEAVGCLVFLERERERRTCTLTLLTDAKAPAPALSEVGSSLTTHSHGSGYRWQVVLTWETGEESLIGNRQVRQSIQQQEAARDAQGNSQFCQQGAACKAGYSSGITQVSLQGCSTEAKQAKWKRRVTLHSLLP